MSARRIITIILSFAFLAFLILCAYSPAQPFHTAAGEETETGEAAEQTGEQEEEQEKLKISE